MITLSKHIGCRQKDQSYKAVTGQNFADTAWAFEHIADYYLVYGKKDHNDKINDTDES